MLWAPTWASIVMAVVFAQWVQAAPEVTKRPEAPRKVAVPIKRVELELHRQPSTNKKVQTVVNGHDEKTECSDQDPSAPCHSVAQTVGPVRRKLKLYSSRGLLSNLVVAAAGFTKRTLNKITRTMFPSLSEKVVDVWAWPMEKFLKTVMSWFTLVVGKLVDFNHNCTTVVGSFGGAIPYLGTIRVTDTKICGLNQIKSGIMKKTLDEKKNHWTFDSFIHFKNFFAKVGSIHTDLIFDIPYIKELNAQGFTMVLDNVTPHVIFKVPTGILPVVESWDVVVNHPDGFRIEFGPDAGQVRNFLAKTITNFFRYMLAHTHFLVKSLNAIVLGAIKLPLGMAGL